LAPTLNGEVTVREGGRVEFLGRELRVLSGSVRYEGPIDDPALDIVAYLPRPPAGVDSITAHVYGSLLHMRFELRGRTTAGDEMSPDSVVMTLLTSGVNLFQSDSVSVAGKMENVLTTAASSQLSGMVGRLAGLDVLEFHAGAGGLSNLASGSLEIGTYVTNRLFVQVLQPIKTTQTGQKVSIEYRLLDWLKLRAQQTGRESSAFDLYLQFDWR
jgi:autotransporter translocation and assembly factor TamB